MRCRDGWSCSFQNTKKECSPLLPTLKLPMALPHTKSAMALTLHEGFFSAGVFSDIYFTDLYDAFIESNKKEDPAERMWSIRSVVSVVVYMQVSVCSNHGKSILYGDNKGKDLSSCFYSDPKSFTSDFLGGSRIVMQRHCGLWMQDNPCHILLHFRIGQLPCAIFM